MRLGYSRDRVLTALIASEWEIEAAARDLLAGESVPPESAGLVGTAGYCPSCLVRPSTEARCCVRCPLGHTPTCLARPPTTAAAAVDGADVGSRAAEATEAEPERERAGGVYAGTCGAPPDAGPPIKVELHIGSAVSHLRLRATNHIWDLVLAVASMMDWPYTEVHLETGGQRVQRARHLSDMRRDVGTGVFSVTARRVRATKAYLVWVQPAAPEDVGIWIGGGPAWGHLEGRMPRKKYSYESGVRQRGVAATECPMTEWRRESDRHDVYREPEIHWFAR